MNGRDSGHRPIGYWLKRADELLTVRIDEVQRANGLTRLGWQIINVVRERGEATVDDVAGVLRPFADGAAVSAALADLADRGVIGRTSAGGFEVTPAGSEVYARAHAAQLAIRERAVAGIDEAEFATTLRVVRRLVANLKGDDAP